VIDDTPRVRWSNAWWAKYLGGVVVPILFAFAAAHAFATGHSFAIGKMFMRIVFVPVYGFQAFLMGSAFIGASLAFFAYCFMRYDERLCAFYEYVLGLALLATAVSLGWCSAIFFTG